MAMPFAIDIRYEMDMILLWILNLPAIFFPPFYELLTSYEYEEVRVRGGGQ